MNKFSGRQLKLIELLANLDDTRSKDQKSVAAGFAPKQVYRLQRDPHFAAAVYQRMKSHLRENLGRIYKSLLERAANGGMKACELLLRASGEIAPGVNAQTNVMQHAYQENPEAFRTAFREAQRQREQRTLEARQRVRLEDDGREAQCKLDEIVCWRTSITFQITNLAGEQWAF